MTRYHELIVRAAAFLALFAIVAFVYSGVRHHDFISLDDEGYVTQNPVVKEGWTASGVRWAFTSSGGYYWQPLTWLSHMADVELHGLVAGRHLLENAALHFLTALFLWMALAKATGSMWRSLAAVALWAAHPLRVESVAWVAERKDVLSGVFFALTLLAAVAYARKPSAGRYLLIWLAAACAMMSKPTAVMLPFALLLFDYWPLERLSRRAIIEKIPLVVMGGAVSVVTFVTQRAAGAVHGLADLSLLERVKHAIVSIASYLGKTIVPAELGIWYPFVQDVPALHVAGATLLIVAITVVAFVLRRRAPWLLMGWLWFLVVLFPVSGLFQSGSQEGADRFTYLPSIGLMIAVVWSASQIRAPRLVRRGVAIAVVIALAIAARAQVAHWRDSESIFRHTVAVTERNSYAELLLGLALLERGDSGAALEPLQNALQYCAPNRAGNYPSWYPRIHHALGVANMAQQQPAAALPHLDRARELQPENEPYVSDAAAAHNDYAVFLMSQRQRDEALQHFATSVKLQPDIGPTRLNLGTALSDAGRDAEALPHLDAAVRLMPDSIKARVQLAVALARLRRPEEAHAALVEAARRDANATNDAIAAAMNWPAGPENLDRALTSLAQQSAAQSR